MDPVQLRIDAEVADALRKVLKLRQDFVDFKDEYKKAVSEMERVNASFSGDRLTRTASQYLAVIKQFGGVQNLTATEQAKVNKVLTEASEKYTKLGREVPEAMQKIILATSQGAAKSQQELDKITKAISGDKVIQQAALYMQALTKVNDVNRLTEQQQIKVNKVLTEAAEAYRRLGIQVPADMQKIMDATGKVAKPATDELKKLRDLLSGEGSLRSANQIVKVLNEIGGVSKIAAEDQKKLLVTMNQLEARFAAAGRSVPADIKRIHDELKKLSSTKDEIKKLEEALSGKKVLADANNWVSAVQRIGGVTRLTSEEQRRLNGILTEAIAKYKALGQEAPRDMQRLLAATKSAGNDTRGIFNALWVDIAKGSFVGNMAANTVAAAWRGVKDMIRGSVEALVDFINRGSQVDRVASAFEKLVPSSKQIVETSKDASRATDEIIEAAKRGSKGLVTNFEAMRAANQALLFGLPITAKEMEVLSRSAVTLGRAMDLDAGKALNDLIIALGRSSPRILDNLGIIVKMVDANQKYADSIGKNRLELTAEERTHAFYRESMTKMGAKVTEIGEIHLTAADKVKQTQVRFADIRDEMARVTASSPVLNRAIQRIGEIILGAFGDDKETQIRRIVQVINQGAIIITKALQGIIFAATIVTASFTNITAAINTWMGTVIKTNENLLEILFRIGAIAAKVPGQVGETGKQLAIMAGVARADLQAVFGTAAEFEKKGSELADMTARILGRGKGMVQEVGDLVTELERLAKIDPFKAIKKSTENLPTIVNNDQANAEVGITKAQERIIKSRESFNIAWDKEQERTREEYKKSVQDAQTFVDEFWRTFDRAGRKINDAAMQLLDDRLRQQFFTKPLELLKLQNEIDELHAKKTFTWVELLNKMGGITRDPGKDPSKWFDKGAIGSAIDALAKSIPQMLRDRLAVSDVGLGTAIASLVASSMGEAFMGPKGFLGKKLGGLFGGAFGETFKAMLPVIGSLAGPLIEKFVDFFKAKKWKDSMKTVGREWGISITEELAKKIKEDADKLFGGDRRVAEAFNFSAILGDTKITEGNIDKLLGKLRDVFVFLGQGKMTVDQARNVLDSNFAKFAEHVEASGEVASDALLEFIQLNRQFGTESVAIHNFLIGQASKLGGALSRMANDTAERYKGLGTELGTAREELKKLDEEIANARARGDSTADLLQKRADLMVKINELQAKQGDAARVSQEEFDRLGRIALAAQLQMQAQGLSSAEIAERMGPAWSRILQIQKDLGLQASSNLIQEELTRQKARETHQTVFEGTAAVNDAAVAYANMGGKSQEVFDDLQKQMQEYFTRLQSTGLTQKQVLEENLPFLRTAIQLQQKHGVVLDATTQMYIDQAKELGLLGETAEEETDKMDAGLKGIGAGLAAIVEALGGDIPEALRKLIGEAEDAGEAAEESMGGMESQAARTVDGVEILVGRFGQLGNVVSLAADEATEALKRIQDEAIRTYEDVTGISEGMSPGGFLGIVNRSREALIAVQDFARSSEPELRRVYESINKIGTGVPGEITIPGGPGTINTGQPPRIDLGPEFREMLAVIRALAEEPTIVFEPGSISPTLQAYGIADREAVERTLALGTLRQFVGTGPVYEKFSKAVNKVR